MWYNIISKENIDIYQKLHINKTNLLFLKSQHKITETQCEFTYGAESEPEGFFTMEKRDIQTFFFNKE